MKSHNTSMAGLTVSTGAGYLSVFVLFMEVAEAPITMATDHVGKHRIITGEFWNGGTGSH